MADAVKKPKTNEIATTRKDIDVFYGWTARLENPDPVLRSEAGGQGLKLYDEAARDAHAGSVLQTRYLAVAGCEWEVTPADDSDQSQKIADCVDDCFTRMGFTQAVQELMKSVLYGFYVAEIMWERRGGIWTPARLVGKHPRRFCFDLDRNLKLFTPDSMIEGEPVPDRKFICLTYGSSDNPYGEGLGRTIWWPVWFKKHGIKYWLMFLEKFGMPTAVGKYPPGTDTSDQGKLLDALDAIQNETGLTIPDNMQVSLLEATRSGKVTYETLCEYMDRQISKAVLGQTASTEGTPGKLGNEDAQDQVRQDLKKADADLVAECLNATLVRWIVDYNFAGVTEYPSVWLRTEPEADLKALAARDEILTRIGVKIPVRYFRDTYGLPEPEGDEETVGGKPAPLDESIDSVGARRAVPETGAPEFAEGRFTPDQQALENLADTVIPAAADAFAQNETAIRAALENAKSYEEAMSALLDLYPGMDMDGLTALIEKTMLNASLFGMSTVTE